MDTSPTAKMDFLHALMAQQGRPCDGMNWRLLVLEWRYDLAVLFGNVRDRMRYVDRQFDRPQDWSRPPTGGAMPSRKNGLISPGWLHFPAPASAPDHG